MENQDWGKSVLESVMLESIKEQRRSRRWKIFFRLVWLVILGLICYFIASGGRSNTITALTGPKVGVVDLTGVISDDNNTYHNVADGLRDALEDKDTVAVIIRANSPGGSPVYSDMLYNEIMRLKTQYPNKPIDVVVEEVCASGCYYMASAANKIYASPASIVGSIGVIYSGFGFTGLMQKAGVDSRLLISGKNKAMGYPFIAENKAQDAMQQQMLDEIHQQFIHAVEVGRGTKLDIANPDLFSGRYWIGQDGIKLGLIDGFATVDNLARDTYKTDNLVDFTPQANTLDRVIKKLGVGLADSAKQMVSLMGTGSFQ